MRNKKGFTLIELLVVIGILAVLLAITLIAINPAQQISSAEDTKRKSDVNAILNAVNQYMVATNGTIPAPITTSPTLIGDAPGEANICDFLVPTYLAALPRDPSVVGGADITSCAGYSTGYSIKKTVANRIVVKAPTAASGTIEVTR